MFYLEQAHFYQSFYPRENLNFRQCLVDIHQKIQKQLEAILVARNAIFKNCEAFKLFNVHVFLSRLLFVLKL